jgi:hypothetical protein
VEDCEPVEDFEEFAGRCDVLLLPALKDSINSVTLPLSVMVAGTVVLAANRGGYYGLNPATGVFLMASDRVKPWKEALRLFESDSLKLERLKEFNMKYARRVSGESLNLISRLEYRLKNIS